MSAWGYEFYLLVLKISHSFAALTREIFFQHSKIKFVSPRGHVISSIYQLYFISVIKHDKLFRIH